MTIRWSWSALWEPMSIILTPNTNLSHLKYFKCFDAAQMVTTKKNLKPLWTRRQSMSIIWTPTFPTQVKSGKPTNIYHFLKHSTGKQVKEMLFKEEQKQLLFHILWKTSSSFSKLVGKLVQNLDKSSFAKVSLFRINLESLIRCISMKWRLKGQGISN